MTTSPKSNVLVVKSAIIRSEKPGKGLETIPTSNPNQMNRLIGFLDDGTKVMVAQRPGKGGMDFTKIAGGKVFAVAADGLTPVYEKDDKPGSGPRVQKLDNGLPLYSSSGFYLLSSKDYPALLLSMCYTRLADKGARLFTVPLLNHDRAEPVLLESEFDLELLQADLVSMLSDDANAVSQFDAEINKKRRRGVERAKEEADDAGEAFGGVEFKELAVSKKDGNPFVVLSWLVGDQVIEGVLKREADVINDAGRIVTEYYTAEQAVEGFTQSSDYQYFCEQLAAGKSLTVRYFAGTVFRPSVSFRRKIENIAMDMTKSVYGDGVYIKGTLEGWSKGLVSVIHSMHPTFPSQDYDAHHYVAAARQSEVLMVKKADGNGWNPPQLITYDLSAMLWMSELAKKAA